MLTTEERKHRKAIRYRNWFVANRERKYASRRAWMLKNPDATRKYHLKGTYGVTKEEVGVLLAEQNHKCAVCGTSDPGRKKDWNVDHCHETKRVRGLLCTRCNLMLGHARDDIEILSSAIEYLKNKLT